MVLAYTVVFGALTWRQQSNFGTFGFDMGIFDQGIWLLSRFHDPFVTVRGLNFFGNHVNPNVLLLVPFYWLGAGPHFLFLVETVALALGAVPVWLLARDTLEDSWLALALAAAYLLFPALEWINWWHFHPEALAVAPLLFAVWLARHARWRWYAVCVVLVLFCKEDAPLTIVALGVIVGIRYNRRAGILTVTAALSWLIVAIKLIIPLTTGYAEPFYIGRAAPLGRSPGEIVANAILHPSRLARLARMKDRVNYFRQLLVPVALVPLLSISGLALAAPQALVNLVSSQNDAHSIKFHYSSLVIPGLFLGLIEGCAVLGRTAAARRFVVGLVVAVSLASNVAWSPSPISVKYHSGIWATRDVQRAAKERAIHMVPGSARVSASYTLVPHLTHRVGVYEFPNPWHTANWGIEDKHPADPRSVDYLVLDTGLNTEQAGLIDQLTAPDGEFQVVYRSGNILLARRQRGGVRANGHPK